MDDVVKDATRLIELARIPWDQQSTKVKSEISKLRTGRADEYARALLADREALLTEIAELKTRMAEGFSARGGQVENGARMIAELQAENAKLRRVLIDAKPILEGFAAKNPRWPKLRNGEIVMQDPAGVFSMLSFIDTLEPPNVPDATDD